MIVSMSAVVTCSTGETYVAPLTVDMPLPTVLSHYLWVRVQLYSAAQRTAFIVIGILGRLRLILPNFNYLRQSISEDTNIQSISVGRYSSKGPSQGSSQLNLT